MPREKDVMLAFRLHKSESSLSMQSQDFPIEAKHPGAYLDRGIQAKSFDQRSWVWASFRLNGHDHQDVAVGINRNGQLLTPS